MLAKRPRNFLVGMTMLAALALLMYGIFLLGKFPSFWAIGPYTVTLTAPNANGVSQSARVELNGVYVGQVKSVYLANDPAGKMVVRLTLQIDGNYEIPASVHAVLYKPQTVGTSYVALEVSDASGPKLPRDNSATLTATAADSSLIPKEIFTDVHDLKDDLSTLSGELTRVARDLHALLAYAPPEAIEKGDPKDPNRPRENASTVVIRLNRTVKSLEDLLTDPKLQGNVRQAIQNIADASAQLKITLQNVDRTVKNADGAINAVGGAATQASATLTDTQQQITRVSQRLVETLSQIEKSVRQISEGDGTTGRLVKDARLYDGLLDLSRSLKTTVDDLDFLLQKWKDEGVNLKLK